MLKEYTLFERAVERESRNPKDANSFIFSFDREYGWTDKKFIVRVPESFFIDYFGRHIVKMLFGEENNLFSIGPSVNRRVNIQEEISGDRKQNLIHGFKNFFDPNLGEDISLLVPITPLEIRREGGKDVALFNNGSPVFVDGLYYEYFGIGLSRKYDRVVLKNRSSPLYFVSEHSNKVQILGAVMPKNLSEEEGTLAQLLFQQSQ